MPKGQEILSEPRVRSEILPRWTRFLFGAYFPQEVLGCWCNLLCSVIRWSEVFFSLVRPPRECLGEIIGCREFGIDQPLSEIRFYEIHSDFLESGRAEARLSFSGPPSRRSYPRQATVLPSVGVLTVFDSFAELLF